MTDVPNDTIAANRDALAAEWLKVTTAYPPPISAKGEEPDPRESMSLGDWVVGELRRRDAELLRLAGPVCDNPPCKGARAIEHKREQLGRICTFIDNPQDPIENWGEDTKRIAELEQIRDAVAANNVVLMDNARYADERIAELTAERTSLTDFIDRNAEVTVELSNRIAELERIVGAVKEAMRNWQFAEDGNGLHTRLRDIHCLLFESEEEEP